MKVQPEEIRQAAVSGYNNGQTAKMLSELFGVTLRTIQRWARQAKDGQTAARPTGHRRRALALKDEKKLEEILNKRPDATLVELCQMAGLTCHPATIYRTLSRLGYSFKKNAKANEQNRNDVAKSRAAWQDKQPAFEASRLVFIDESAAKTNMVRLYGRTLIGERCYGYAPYGHWTTTTMIGSVRLNGQTTCLAMKGGTSGAVFREYVRQILVPTLTNGDIVIADNLSAHRNQDAQKLIEAAGAKIIFLPPYSPDFNPIEKMWSKIKQSLRSSAARTYDSLLEAMKKAFDSVTADDAQGWFQSCEYTIS